MFREEHASTAKIHVLVTGAGGQLGNSIQQLAKNAKLSRARFMFVDRDSLNICNRAEVQNFFSEHQVDILVNCAAYTNVDKAETDAKSAYAINKEGVGVLADCCLENNVFMIHVSTDYVFDGKHTEPYTEEDETRPIGVYGASKREGELEMIRSGVHGLIIRTAWLYSEFGKNFVKTMLKLFQERTSVYVVSDQIGSPTWARDLADCILSIIDRLDLSRQKGVQIYHYTNEGQCSWYEFASAIMTMVNAKCQVHPVSTDEYPTSSMRPSYSVLSKEKLKRDFGIQIPLWDDSLEEMLQNCRID